jgi:hypothetical protein
VPPPPVCEPPTGSPGFTVRWDRVDQGVGDTEHLLVALQLQLLRLVVALGGVGVDLVDQMGVVRREGVGEGFDGELVADDVAEVQRQSGGEGVQVPFGRGQDDNPV